MTRLRTTAAALLVAALIPAAAADAKWQTFGPPAATVSHAESPRQLLKRARRAFRSGVGTTELTPLLRQLALRLPELRGAERRQAASLLARPTDGSADPQQNGYGTAEAPGSPACGPNFCVHWVATGADAPDLADGNGNGAPDYVDSASAAAEQSHSVENDQLGWREPKGDGARGGNAKVDIYVKQLGGTGIYGYAAPDPGQSLSAADHSQFAYLVIDDDYQKSEFPQYASPLTPLQVTLAHEYNHILQFNYDVLQDTWMFESTAVYMEGKVFPLARDYLQYLPGWTELTAVPITTFNGTDPNDRRNVKVYGSAVWNKWLDARYGAEVVRGAWEVSLSTEPPSYAVGAYDSSIRARGGGGFASEFNRFAAATAEWRAANSGFPEGSVYPDVMRAGAVVVNDKVGQVTLNHTTYALVDVRPTTAPRIKLAIVAPDGTDAALALVARSGPDPGGTSVVALKDLPDGGVGSVVLENPSQYARLTAVLVNSDAETRGGSQTTGDWIYTRDEQPFAARVSTDFTGPRVARSTPRSGATRVAVGTRVKVVFSEPMLRVDRESLRLFASNGRAVKATVKFKRGSRTAVLVPARKLGRGRRYRVRVSRAAFDTAVNPLRKATAWSFTTR